MRRVIAFASGGEQLVATLDLPSPPSRVGVLIVSGGAELRCGAHRGMAMLACELAEAGVATLRFDRTGIGDSTGTDRGFAASATDLDAAARLLRDEAGVAAIVAVGNCDAASGLALHGRRCGLDAVVLTNPWLREEDDALPPAAAIRSRYAARLRDPASWRRLLRGAIDLGKLARGVAKIARRGWLPRPADPLAARVLDGIAEWQGDAAVLLARGDATAIAFADAAGDRFALDRVDTASHSFAGDAARAALRTAILAQVARIAGRG